MWEERFPLVRPRVVSKKVKSALNAGLTPTVSIVMGTIVTVVALGLAVNRLIRISYGPFELGTLPAGKADEVGPQIVR